MEKEVSVKERQVPPTAKQPLVRLIPEVKVEVAEVEAKMETPAIESVVNGEVVPIPTLPVNVFVAPVKVFEVYVFGIVVLPLAQKFADEVLNKLR